MRVVNSELKTCINGIINEDCTRTLSEIKQLTEERIGVTTSLSTLHRTIEGLNFSLKRIVISPIARNTQRTIEERYDYAVEFIGLKNTYSEDEFFS
jgi:hypothetical protein